MKDRRYISVKSAKLIDDQVRQRPDIELGQKLLVKSRTQPKKEGLIKKLCRTPNENQIKKETPND